MGTLSSSYQLFPPVENADENGLLALGGDLSIPLLLDAYSQGIFPWPLSEQFPIAWFSPDPRGILCFKDLHISRSLNKVIKQQRFKVSFNKNFEAVIINCASSKKRKEGEGTWITRQMIDAYIELFKAGYAFSVETYLNEELVGGMYGVSLNGIISGESMFYLEPNASKIALIHLMEKLNSIGIDWIDTQMITPVVESLGGKEISRAEFIAKLQRSSRHDKFVPWDKFQA